MIRLDRFALQAMMRWSKGIYAADPQQTPMKEELSTKANVLWNIATTILRNDEPFGNEAIHLMRVAAYLESNKEDWSISQRWYTPPPNIFLLMYYNLADIKLKCAGVVHRLFYDVICESNGSHEKDILRTCLSTKHPVRSERFESINIESLKRTWGEALMYPELVNEFKSIGIKECVQCYKYYEEEGRLSIANKTFKRFEELFGATDADTVLLMSYEYRFMSKEHCSNQMDLQSRCKQVRPIFEAYTRSMADDDWRVFNKIYKAEREVQLYARDEEYTSEEFLTESILFYMSIATICIQSLHGEGAHLWLNMIKKYLKRMPRTSETLDLLQTLRSTIWSDTLILGPVLPIWQSEFFLALSVTLFDLRSYAKESADTDFKKKVSQGLLNHLEIHHGRFLKVMSLECTEDTAPEFLELLNISWSLISGLIDSETIHELLSVMESINKMLKKVLHVNHDEFQMIREYLYDNGEILRVIHEGFLEFATSSDIDESLKNEVLEKSLIYEKCILAAYTRQSAIMWVDPWKDYIETCSLELNSYEEFEKCVLEHFNENTQETLQRMIRFGFRIIDKLRLAGTQECGGPLIETTLKSTQKYLKILLDENPESFRKFDELKEMANDTIEFCQAHIKEDP